MSDERLKEITRKFLDLISNIYTYDEILDKFDITVNELDELSGVFDDDEF